MLAGSSDLPSGQATGSRLPCPIWSCSGWGLHGQHVSMLPVSSYLTISTLPQPYCFGGMFLLHFPYSYLRRTLSGTLALRSPDFPHKPEAYAIVCSTRGCYNLSQKRAYKGYTICNHYCSNQQNDHNLHSSSSILFFFTVIHFQTPIRLQQTDLNLHRIELYQLHQFCQALI